VAVVFVPRTARAGGGRTDLAHVGPITVARGSTHTLKIAFAGLAAVILALVATALALWIRMGRLRREHELQVAAGVKAQAGSLAGSHVGSQTAPPRSLSMSARAPGQPM
jgi:hypothetical protein